MEISPFSQRSLGHKPEFLAHKSPGPVLKGCSCTTVKKCKNREGPEQSTDAYSSKLPSSSEDVGEEGTAQCSGEDSHRSVPLAKPRNSRTNSLAQFIGGSYCVPVDQSGMKEKEQEHARSIFALREAPGVISPPPVFQTPRLITTESSKSRSDEDQHDSMLLKETLHELHKLRVTGEVQKQEAAELRKISRELRKKKIAVEQQLEITKKERDEMDVKMREQVNWIQLQMERNYRLSGYLEDARILLLEEKMRRERIFNPANNLDEDLVFSCEYEKKIEEYAEYIKQWDVANLVNAMINDLSQESSELPREGKKSSNEEVSLVDKQMYLDTKVRLEELMDENEISKKWKNMYTELLVLNNRAAGLMDMVPSQVFMQYGKRVVLTDQPVILPKETVECQRELAETKATISKLKDAINVLNNKASEREHELKACHEKISKNVQLKPREIDSTQQPEDVAYKLSLIILGKVADGGFSEKDMLLIRQIMGESVIKFAESTTEHFKETQADCRNIIRLAKNKVFARCLPR